MSSLYIVGTCQAKSLALLCEGLLECFSVDFTCYLSHTAYRPEAISSALDSMRAADIIFVQRDGFGPYHHDAIRTAFPDKTHILTTAVFRGLHPDNCYVGAVGDHFQDPSLYHSVAILDAFRQGRSVSWAIKNALTFENFNRLALMDAWNVSLDDVRRQDALADFSIAPLVERYCCEFPGFLNFNHPTISLLYEYMKSVFDKLGIKTNHFNTALLQDPLIEHDVVPIYDFVADALDLPYRTSQLWRLGHTKKFISKDEYILSCYAHYAKTQSNKLVIDSPQDLIEHYKTNQDLSYLAGVQIKKRGWRQWLSLPA